MRFMLAIAVTLTCLISNVMADAKYRVKYEAEAVSADDPYIVMVVSDESQDLVTFVEKTRSLMDPSWRKDSRAIDSHSKMLKDIKDRGGLRIQVSNGRGANQDRIRRANRACLQFMTENIEQFEFESDLPIPLATLTSKTAKKLDYDPEEYIAKYEPNANQIRVWQIRNGVNMGRDHNDNIRPKEIRAEPPEGQTKTYRPSSEGPQEGQ